MATKTFAGWILGLAMVFGLMAAAFLSSGTASAAPGDSVGHSSTRSAPARSPQANSARPNGFATLLNNRTPTLAPTHTSPVGRVVQGQFHANDPDGDSLTYSVAMNPAHGSVVISGDDFTYTLDQSLAQTGATDSFQVAVSDAGRGFHIHGLAGLINLLSFGIVGSSGHTAVGTVSVSVPGLPVDPAPDPVGALRPEDLTFEGLFRVPTGVIGDGDYATLAYGGAAMASREVDGQRRFFFTGHRYANDPLVEVAAPDTLGLTPKPRPSRPSFDYWGDIYGGSKTTAEEPDGSVPNANWTEGLLWDEAGQRLFWSYGNWYAASHDNNPVLGATELGADGSISAGAMADHLGSATDPFVRAVPARRSLGRDWWRHHGAGRKDAVDQRLRVVGTRSACHRIAGS
ncbi:MAG: Ig-like domain-containing protein [Mycobacterium sp.]